MDRLIVSFIFVCVVTPSLHSQDVGLVFIDDQPWVRMEVASTKTITYSVKGNAQMSTDGTKIEAAEVRRRIDSIFAELSTFSGAKFKKVGSGGKLRIEFRPQSKMQYGALGLAWSSGRIYINSSRALNGKTRIVETVVAHESLHVLGFDHVPLVRPKLSIGGCIMDPWAGYYFLCKDEVRRLQRKYGLPSRPFYSSERAIIGNQLRPIVSEFDTLTAHRHTLLEARNAEADAVKRAAIQKRVLENVADIRQNIARQKPLAKRWNEVNNYWRGVPSAVTF